MQQRATKRYQDRHVSRDGILHGLRFFLMLSFVFILNTMFFTSLPSAAMSASSVRTCCASSVRLPIDCQCQLKTGLCCLFEMTRRQLLHHLRPNIDRDFGPAEQLPAFLQRHPPSGPGRDLNLASQLHSILRFDDTGLLLPATERNRH